MRTFAFASAALWIMITCVLVCSGAFGRAKQIHTRFGRAHRVHVSRFEEGGDVELGGVHSGMWAFDDGLVQDLGDGSSASSSSEFISGGGGDNDDSAPRLIPPGEVESDITGVIWCRGRLLYVEYF